MLHIESRRLVSLVDVDEELAGLLEASARERARRELLVTVASLNRGVWDDRSLRRASCANAGLLILDGVVAREVVLAGDVSTELLGPGDLIRPWGAEEQGQARWNVLAAARVAVLDASFMARAAAYPGVAAMLLERVEARARRLALAKAIAQMTRVEDRLVAIFRHFAERWGRVTPEGVVVPLRLSHRMLGELIGARRPTVSTSAGALERAGALRRRTDGSWVLGAHTADAGVPAPESIPQRRRLLAA